MNAGWKIFRKKGTLKLLVHLSIRQLTDLRFRYQSWRMLHGRKGENKGNKSELKRKVIATQLVRRRITNARQTTWEMLLYFVQVQALWIKNSQAIAPKENINTVTCNRFSYINVLCILVYESLKINESTILRCNERIYLHFKGTKENLSEYFRKIILFILRCNFRIIETVE